MSALGVDADVKITYDDAGTRLAATLWADEGVSIDVVGAACPVCGGVLAAAGGSRAGSWAGRLAAEHDELREPERDEGWYAELGRGYLYCDRPGCPTAAALDATSGEVEVVDP